MVLCNRMKKILLIGNYKAGVGGISGQMEILHKHLTEYGIECRIFNTSCNVIRRIFLFPKLIFTGRHYDIFHVHGCSYWGFFPIVLASIISKILRKRLIITYHGGDAQRFFGRFKFLIRYFNSHCEQVTVPSGFLKDVFASFGISCNVLPNIIENSLPFKERNIIYPNYISMRSLYPLYNISCIIRAFGIVQKSLPEAKLTILGDGPERENLERLVSSQNIPNIMFVGRVNNKDIYPYLERNDIFLSSPIIDNMPVSIIEAFSAGLLVISSNVGGISYVVENRKTGYLFDSNDYMSLAKLMIEAVENQELTRNMIRAALVEAHRYRWEYIKNDLLKIYDGKY